MEYYSSHIQSLVEELSRLPGIGAKTAARLAFHIISMPEENVERLSRSIMDAKQNVRFCKCCQTLTDEEYCPICSSGRGYYFARTQDEINDTVSRLNELVTGVSNARTGLLYAKIVPDTAVEIIIRFGGSIA